MNFIDGAEAEALADIAKMQEEIFTDLVVEVKCAENFFASLLESASKCQEKSETHDQSEKFVREVHKRLTNVLKRVETYISENEKAQTFIQAKFKNENHH